MSDEPNLKRTLMSPAVWASGIVLAVAIVGIALFVTRSKPAKPSATAPAFPPGGPVIQARQLSLWVDDMDINAPRPAHDEALRVLRPVAKEMVPILIAMLGDAKVDPHQKGNVVQTLGFIGSKTGLEVDLLIGSLKSEVTYVRYSAVYSLYRLNADRRVVAPLITEMLGDPDPGVRRSSAEVLGSMGPVAAPAIPALEKLAVDPGERVRTFALAAIEKIKASIPANDPELSGRPLTAWVNDLDPRGPVASRDAAVKILTPASPAIVSELMARLKNTKTERRHRGNVAQALGFLGSKGGPETPLLFECLDDEDNYVVYSAIYSLRRLGLESQRLVPLFIQRLDSSDKSVRRGAAENLGLLGADAGSAVARLTKMGAEEDDVYNRNAAKAALGRIAASKNPPPKPAPKANP